MAQQRAELKTPVQQTNKQERTGKLEERSREKCSHGNQGKQR
jgi:hypothetical protein